jgi:pyruvate dehydrogenase E2 component (dihydrolipoamide acetyltransferase)
LTHPGPSGTVPLSRLQKTVARRMVAAKTEIPEFTTEVEIEMTAVRDLRESLKHEEGSAPSYNDFAVRACALALRRVPKLNASFSAEGIEYHDRVNVGVAVATEDALVVPTVFDADRKSPAEIAADVRRLAAKVKEGSIKLEELVDQTFTVSNLGMHGVRRFTAIITPPQVGILALGEAHEALVPGSNGEALVSTRIAAVLTSDHRVVYGADAARFLAALKELLESPRALLSSVEMAEVGK